MLSAFHTEELAELKNSALYFTAAKNRAQEAAEWFKLATLAKAYTSIPVAYSYGVPYLWKAN